MVNKHSQNAWTLQNVIKIKIWKSLVMNVHAITQVGTSRMKNASVEQRQHHQQFTVWRQTKMVTKSVFRSDLAKMIRNTWFRTYLIMIHVNVWIMLFQMGRSRIIIKIRTRNVSARTGLWSRKMGPAVSFQHLQTHQTLV